jgi:hypothetical protein
VFDFTIDNEFEKSSSNMRKIENQNITITQNQKESLNIAVGKHFRGDYERITQGVCTPPTKPFSTDNWQQIQ